MVVEKCRYFRALTYLKLKANIPQFTGLRDYFLSLQKLNVRIALSAGLFTVDEIFQTLPVSKSLTTLVSFYTLNVPDNGFFEGKGGLSITSKNMISLAHSCPYLGKLYLCCAVNLEDNERIELRTDYKVAEIQQFCSLLPNLHRLEWWFGIDNTNLPEVMIALRVGCLNLQKLAFLGDGDWIISDDVTLKIATQHITQLRKNLHNLKYLTCIFSPLVCACRFQDHWRALPESNLLVELERYCRLLKRR